MRAGEIRHRAELLELGPDLQERCLGRRWVGIVTEEAAAPAAPTSLRNPVRVDIRARYCPQFVIGRYLRQGGRLFHITSVRDPIGNRAELRITGDELMGVPGQALVNGLAPRPCRVFLAFDVPFVNQEYAEAPILRTYAEVALIEAGRVEEGDQLVASGVRYTVLSLAKDQDDGVVRGLWLEAES